MKQPTPPREIFLDFDPVFPDWPHNGYPDEVEHRDEPEVDDPKTRKPATAFACPACGSAVRG